MGFDTRWFVGFFDSLLSSSPQFAKAQAVIGLGLVRRRELTRAALSGLMGRHPADAELDGVLAASSHGTVIREVAKATGVDLLRTLADKLDARPGPGQTKPG